MKYSNIVAHYGAKQCGISHSHKNENDQDHDVPLSYTVAASMAEVGLVHAWVQLGHDGLPQEAGCPLQVREIYDSWRSQEHGCYKEELEMVDKEIMEADMILVFGSSPSLTGETADKLGQISQREYGSLGHSLGLIIISQHQTDLDKFATIRINGPPDDTLRKLKESLDVDSMEPVEIKLNVTEACSEVADVGTSSADMQAEDATAFNAVKNSEKEVACLDSSHRAFVADALTHFTEIKNDDPRIYHGRMLSETCLEAPEEVNGSFEDKTHTLDYKIEKMINLVKLSKKTVFFMDALESDPVSCTLNKNLDGISKNKFLLLSHLKKKSLVDFVLQVGHDGVLQKSGFLPNQVVEIYDKTMFESEDIEKVEMVLDNTDLVILSGEDVDMEIVQLMVRKISDNSKRGLRYEDGGSLGFVVIGNSRTSCDFLASLKINSGVNNTIMMLVEKLSITEEETFGVGRDCVAAEHRNMLGAILRQIPSNASDQIHGKILAAKTLPNNDNDEEDDSLDMKISYLNILLTASKRTMILTEADTSQVFHSGAPYGAKCGMSDPDNTPYPLHYQLAALHNDDLLHVWVQHGHDGLPQRAGFSVDHVIEVYNSWFDLPEDPHNLELDKLRSEVDQCDLVIVLDTGHDIAGAGVTRQSVLTRMLDSDSDASNLGVVTISKNNRHQPEQSKCLLNIFAEANVVFGKLLKSLNIEQISSVPRNICCLHLASALVTLSFYTFFNFYTTYILDDENSIFFRFLMTARVKEQMRERCCSILRLEPA